jgi:hypothetical protein
MSTSSVFSALSSTRIAAVIRSANTRVVDAAPGIQMPAAQEIVRLKESLLAPNEPDFIDAVKKAFPDQNWDKVYSEFRAVEEKKQTASTKEIQL